MSKKKPLEETPKNGVQQETHEIIESISKKYGEGIITVLGRSKFKDQPTLSTGSLILDREAGGGYPLGKIVEIYGEHASGKTTLALHAVRECQKKGKQAVWFDVENALNAKHALNVGVDINKLLVVHPQYGEQCFELMAGFIKEGAGLIVVDSVAPLMPAELLGNWEKPPIGAHAKMMNNGLRQIIHETISQEAIIIFINQIRYKISTGFSFGNPETTTGGAALPYYTSLRIRLKNKREKIEKEGKNIGFKVSALVYKTRLISSYLSSKDSGKEKYVDIEIMFKGGIKKEREVIDLATELNILQKSGNWYSYQGQKLGNGREAAIDHLIKNPQIYSEIEQAVTQNSVSSPA
jgi:recombination protein RecA